MNSSPSGPGKNSWRGTFISIIVLIIVGLIIGFLLDQPDGLFRSLPVSLQNGIRAILVLLVGIGVSRLLERRLFRLAVNHLRPDQSTSLKYLVRLLLYITIILSILAAVGVGLSSLVFGGAFATVLIGLAGQQVFANIIAGVWLLVFHPFRVGDHIGLVTWQYPMLMPSYPHEAMRPTYYGHVRDINLMYTVLENSDGFSQQIPNGIIVQAFIENRASSHSRHMRIRLDIPLDFDANEYLDQLQTELDKHILVTGERNLQVKLSEISVGGYSLLVTMDTGRDWEVVRSEVLRIAARILSAMRSEVCVKA